MFSRPYLEAYEEFRRTHAYFRLWRAVGYKKRYRWQVDEAAARVVARSMRRKMAEAGTPPAPVLS